MNSSIADSTNEQLQAVDKQELTHGELLRFFGLLILITRFNFASRQDLWSNRPTMKVFLVGTELEATGLTVASHITHPLIVNRRMDVRFRTLRVVSRA